ncbi:MAG: hypothetical protein IPF59_08680 [Ignavibacteria bacterium]|nr:hypothetical protein [Ignavibacteria bacterium]MBK6420402.1 hypothetical protein [Ignavibacteria bacterium]
MKHLLVVLAFALSLASCASDTTAPPTEDFDPRQLAGHSYELTSTPTSDAGRLGVSTGTVVTFFLHGSDTLEIQYRIDRPPVTGILISHRMQIVNESGYMAVDGSYVLRFDNPDTKNTVDAWKGTINDLGYSVNVTATRVK